MSVLIVYLARRSELYFSRGLLVAGKTGKAHQLPE